MSGSKQMSRKFLAAALLVGFASVPFARDTAPSSTDEARSWVQLQRMKPMAVMHLADADGKGYVTRDEFIKFQERLFDRMDRNHDGKVTTPEWMGARESPDGTHSSVRR